MKKKNISKKVLAVLLSVVMLLTSIPMIIGTAAGTYDPAPYFDDAAQTEGARAWLDEEGNVQVTFPSATAQPTYKGEALSIAFYILELVDMGANNAAHTEVVLDTIKVTGNAGTFKAADIGTIDLETKRYSVTVTAVDTENWFSLPIYASVTDVPVADIDASRFANFSTSATAVREIMTFDQSDDDTGVATGNALLYMGLAAEAGTEDLSDNVGDTSALRFIMYNQPSGTQTFDTSMSRQTWDFSNATEVWFWMDLSRVELTGISFRLRANEKVWYDWGSDQDMTVTQKDYMGDIIYSTKGYTGTDGYVWVQREDGGWDKVSLTNGTVDLGNFKGYVRVPIAFICSENASYAQLKNTGFNNGSTDFATGFFSNSLGNGDSHANGIPITKTLVDAAGTNIKDARLMQHRIVATKTGLGGTGNENYWHFTNGSWVRNETEGITRGEDAMIAAGLSEAEAVSDTDEGYKAIDDLYSAGFAFEGASADSLQNSFFVDNIFFYDENGGPWDENAISGMTSSTGNSMATYYDEEAAIAKIIFDEIDKYITDPDWADYRELDYILDLIAEYKDLYASQGKSTAFLDLTRNTAEAQATSGLAYMATQLNRDDTWENAWKAFEACTDEKYNTYGKANAGKDDLLPLIINTMEKLPAPENITSVSEALRAEIVTLWQAYSLLNLGQLEMLGATEEATLLKYFALVENLEELDGDEFIVGQQLADYPYILYNDFESQELGTEGWRLEDNKDAYSTGFTSVDGKSAGTHNPDGGVYTMANSWRHLKGLVTYTTNGDVNISNAGDYGYSPTDSSYSEEVMDGRLNYNASSATITDNGYLNSHAVTMDIDSSFTTDNQNGVFHTVTLTRQGKDSASWADFQANNTGLDGLGNFSTENVTGDTSIGLSLIFYVDFSELESFYFTTNVYTADGSGTPIKARPNMGIALTDDTKIDDWKYFILDPDTGEWVINHTTSQWCFTSTMTDASWGDTMSLDGYKGYIMIPLYHIKIQESTTSEAKLDGNATWLNNIYAIQFCIGGANGASLDEKSFTIDNVGFTYDPAGYATHTWKSYAETFGAKSLPASNFEAAVDAIDPYDDANLSTAVQAAQAIYITLPDYQKTVVADAYAKLQLYITYVNNPANVPQPAIEATEMANLVAALPDAAKTAQVSGKSADGTIDYDLTHPGFTNGEVNYSTYGLTAETAATIIDYYNNSYKYYSAAEKAAIDSTSLINAYNAAMRCVGSLESIKAEAGNYRSVSAGIEGSGFLGAISTDLYTLKYDDAGNYIGGFVSIAGRDDVESFKETEYDTLQYYTKATMEDGTYNSNVEDISQAFTYFLNNTQSFTVDGETINGGIITFRDKMQDIYDMANDHITNKTLFTDEEFQSVKDIIEEYNALLSAYYSVEELYALEQAILALFPTASTETLDVTEVMLTADKLTGDTSTYKVTYSEILDYDGSGDYYYIKVTSANGAMVNDYGDNVPYNIAINSDTKTSDAIVAASPYTATVTNNAYTPTSPMSYAITPSVSAAQTGLSGTVRDTLKVEFVLMEDGVETVIETQSIEVSYSMGDAYTVTIPASFPVEWEDSTAQDVSYSVTTEMVATSSLKVGVTNDGTGTLTNTVTDDVLNYTAENFVETEFGSRVTDAKPDPAPTVSVSGWDDVPVGEYKTTLTYTVVYDDGSDDSTT